MNKPNVWEELEAMRVEFTQSVNIQRPMLEAMLDQYNAVASERDEMKAECDRFREKVKSARNYAGERCSPQEGLVLVHMLEKALGGKE